MNAMSHLHGPHRLHVASGEQLDNVVTVNERDQDQGCRKGEKGISWYQPLNLRAERSKAEAEYRDQDSHDAGSLQEVREKTVEIRKRMPQ